MIIDIYADFICPWCYIGKHRLERALRDRPELAVDRRWQPFQLNPEMPREGMSRRAYLAAKFGGVERASHIYAVIEETAARDGLPIALDRIARTPNTLDAHRLVRFADRRGVAEAVVTGLFRAYFRDGRDIGDRDVLCDIAAGAGLDGVAIRAQLEGEDEAAAVRASDVSARQMGIQAVPCYVFNRRYAFAGAQESQAFIPLLDLARIDDPATAGA